MMATGAAAAFIAALERLGTQLSRFAEVAAAQETQSGYIHTRSAQFAHVRGRSSASQKSRSNRRKKRR